MPPAIQLSIIFSTSAVFLHAWHSSIMIAFFMFLCDYFTVLLISCHGSHCVMVFVLFCFFLFMCSLCSVLLCFALHPSLPEFLCDFTSHASPLLISAFTHPLHSRHPTVCTQRCSHPLPPSHLTDPCHYWPSNARLQRWRWSHALRPPWRCGLPGLHPLHQADLAPSCWTAWRWCHLLGLLQPGRQ